MKHHVRRTHPVNIANLMVVLPSSGNAITAVDVLITSTKLHVPKTHPVNIANLKVALKPGGPVKWSCRQGRIFHAPSVESKGMHVARRDGGSP